jgi:hypothetical protein
VALLVVGSAGITGSAAAQAPSTDIYLGRLTVRGETVSVARLTNITDRDGYDNQPHFTPDGTGLLYTSIREDGQADTYRFDFTDDGSISRLTRTLESEYSPTTTPNGLSFSVVRVEADSTQRLWSFHMDGGVLGVLLENVKPVGYHAWGDENTVALYVLGSPSTLQLADLRTGEAAIIERNVGRSMHPVPGRHAVSFVHQPSQEDSWIKLLDLETMQIESLARTVPGNEFHAWMPGGMLITASGSKLYVRTILTDPEWAEIADLEDAGSADITRIAVSPGADRIAIVARRAAPDPD